MSETGGFAQVRGLTRAGILILVVICFVAVFALRLVVDNPGQPVLFLLVAPIGLLAAEFGLAGGLVGAAVASASVIVWELLADPNVTPFGYAVRWAVFFSAAVAVGSLANARRELDEEHTRWFEEVSDLNCVADMEGRFVRVNKAFEKTLGYSSKDLLSTPYIAYVHPNDREATSAMAKELAEGRSGVINFENRYLAADGTYRWLRWSSTTDPARRVIYASARDVTEQKELENKLRSLARSDSLTGLFNRRYFDEEAQRQLDFVRRYGHRAALFAFDVDNFKSLNDTLGHRAGDEALKKFALALTERIRKTDIAARIGGDEFALFLPGVGSSEAETIAQVLLASIRKESKGIGIEGRGITSSLGIALFSPHDEVELDGLLDTADLAMYTAKRAGGDRYDIADVLDLAETSRSAGGRPNQIGTFGP
ncbi:MAG: diguanylate cyclase domain-containing protein [Actinomycetota bacterium]